MALTAPPRDLLLEFLQTYLRDTGWAIGILRDEANPKILIKLERWETGGIRRIPLVYPADMVPADIVRAIIIHLKLLGCLSTYRPNA